jgi:hypothetical protein
VVVEEEKMEVEEVEEVSQYSYLLPSCSPSCPGWRW